MRAKKADKTDTMIKSKTTTRVSTCYFLGNINIKSTKNHRRSITQPLTGRKYVLRGNTVQDILSEKNKVAELYKLNDPF